MTTPTEPARPAASAASLEGDQAAPPTDFERKLSVEIDKVYGRRSGTVWGGVQGVLGPRLGLVKEAVGAISVTEDGVKNNRPLSAGLITTPRQFLLIVVDPSVGLAKQRQTVKQLIPLTRHLTTVGLAEPVDGIWRVRQIIDIEGVGIGDQVKDRFPLVRSVESVPLVPIGAAPSDQDLDSLPSLFSEAAATDDSDDPSLIIQGGVQAVIDRVLQRVTQRQLVFPDANRVVRQCVLALARGHLVLHGPPGTAKTTLARILVSEFGCSESLRTATSDWSTYDVIGGFRPGTDGSGREVLRVHRGCLTEAVLTCQATVSDNTQGRSRQQAHWLVIDEMNRAEIDKAIGPLYTVLGGDIRSLPLWFEDDAMTASLHIPRRFRIVATMNDVDTAYVTDLSQGLARRFTFVYLGVPEADQVAVEMDRIGEQAARWLATEYAALLDSTVLPQSAAEALLRREDVQTAMEHLRELVMWLRYPDVPHAFGVADVASGGDTEDDAFDAPAAGPTGVTVSWPLGSAQVLDVVRQLLLSATFRSDVGAVLDDAVADLVVPQFAHAPRSLLNVIIKTLSSAGSQWANSCAKMHRLLNPLAV